MGARERGTMGSPGGGSRGARGRGFTLTEVLIALAIMAIGMLGVIAAFAAAVDLHKRGVDQTSAAFLAETILDVKQAEALEGKSADELSTREGGRYVFRRSELYPGYEYKILCTELSDREYRMTVEVRMRTASARKKPADDAALEAGNVRFETILLRR